MGLDSVEYRDACRMDTIEQLGLVLAETICGAPIIGKQCNGSINSGVEALPESPTHSSFMNANNMINLNMEANSATQLQVLLQAQALLKTSEVYLKLDEALHKVQYFRTNLQSLNKNDGESEDDDHVGALHRDTAISNLRFLNIFYGYSPLCFALATNLLDRILSRVRTHPRYLSCIATSCFYIAAKTCDEKYIPTAQELVKLSQCGGTAQDLLRMERLVLDKIQYQVQSVNPLLFMQYFCQILASKDARFETPGLLSAMVAKLEVLLCQYEFAKYRSETLALCLVSCILQDMDLLRDVDIFTCLLEFQGFCQISDGEFLQCRALIIDYINMYTNQSNKLPRLRLVWTVSRRTLNKMKPSTRILLDLEPIFEDEDDELEESDDAGPFDSENEIEAGGSADDAGCDTPFMASRSTAVTTTVGPVVLATQGPMLTTTAGNDSNNNMQKCYFTGAQCGNPGESFMKMHSSADNDDVQDNTDGVGDGDM